MRAALALSVLFLPGVAAQDAPESWTLRGESGAWHIEPATLRIRYSPDSGAVDWVVTDGLGRFEGGGGRGPGVASLRTDEVSAAWSLGDLGLTVRVHARGERLEVELTSSQVQRLVWPVLPVDSGAIQELALPLAEGVRVRTDDDELLGWLVGRGELSVTEAFTLPAIGLHRAADSMHCLFVDPYYTTLRFEKSAGGLVARAEQQWTSNRVGAELRVVFEPGGTSRLSVAQSWRRWVQEHGEFTDLATKIARNPLVGRLGGASHVYLWGSEPFSTHDVPRPKWRAFAQAFVAASADPESFVGGLAAAMSAEARAALVEIAGLEYPHDYVKSEAARGLGAALRSYRPATLPAGCTAVELLRRNRDGLVAALGEFLAAPETWGEGVSTALLDELHDAGFERLLLCTADLFDAADRPEVVARAGELGYLMGPYDSYHSIHAPGAHPDQTWPTAQFDAELYEQGRIVGLDGEAHHGFKQRGYHLSPLAARPWVERRVNGLLEAVPFSAWFVDCDGYGEFFDDICPEHPATRQDDAAARRARLRWLETACGLVVGSEGASAVMAESIHFAHGVTTPVFGWGDPLLTERDSPHFLGRYWPPEQPTRFFKAVPVAPKFRRPWFTPADRLPLFRAALGDSVVATHHWGYASRKFAGEEGTTELLEMLYVTPPLYHLNRSTWRAQRAHMVRHNAFFAPLHRALATAPLVGFEHLDAECTVQRATYKLGDDEVRITANFGTGGFALVGVELPGRSVRVDGQIELTQRVYTVAD